MKKALLRAVVTYFVFLVIFIIEKPVFMAVYSGLYGDASFSDYIDVIANGMAIDRSIAAYLTVIPCLVIISMLVVKSKVNAIISRIYFGIIAFILAAVFIADTVLYGYWGFKLDVTPIFYFMSSPASAMASATAGEALGGIVALIALTAAFYFLFAYTSMRVDVEPLPRGRSRNSAIAVMAVLTGLLFIPIRGGVTVSTMNLSRAYFSDNQRLNHAAVNPAFSLLYSATHQSDFASQYRYTDDAEADSVFSSMTYTAAARPDTVTMTTDRPDIWIIIAESFSSHLMPSLGGEPVAMRLDSIAADGMLFTGFYASSFRTDRALPAILSGFPGQPNTSVMKYVRKAEKLPSMPRRLRDAGYNTAYYYGGDINFTNMLAYVVSSGFGHIVCDKDFPLAERTGKWGAHDHVVFARALDELRADTTSSPRLRVIQTSSSHEPFEVPFRSRFDDERLSAFAYSDSCIGAFVDSLAASPRYDRSLVIIVPDHYGVWPRNLSDRRLRHTVPLVFTGGALRRRGERIDVVGSQTDLAATVLALCGLPHDEFIYSKDLLDSDAPHFAFFTDTDAVGMVTATDTVVYNLDADRPDVLAGPTAGETLRRARVCLQKIYDNLSDL